MKWLSTNVSISAQRAAADPLPTSLTRLLWLKSVYARPQGCLVASDGLMIELAKVCTVEVQWREMLVPLPRV